VVSRAVSASLPAWGFSVSPEHQLANWAAGSESANDVFESAPGFSFWIQANHKSRRRTMGGLQAVEDSPKHSLRQIANYSGAPTAGHAHDLFRRMLQAYQAAL